MATDFDRHQRRLQEQRWTWDDMPFYGGPGTRPDIGLFHQLDYLDVYERVYGRPIGANGIGRLREVALAPVTGAENRAWDDAPAAAALAAHGLGRIPNLDRFRAEHEAYAETLEREGVRVHWIDTAAHGTGAPGLTPLHGGWGAHDLLVVRGGAIVGRRPWNPLAAGHVERLAAWAFWQLNIPTLLTVAGRGIAEAGATPWLAEDVLVVGLSIAYDENGLAQVIDAVKLTAGVEHLEVLTVRCQGARYLDRTVGTSAHVTNVLAPLDAGTVLCHPAGIDTATLLWLREHDYALVEVDPDEQAEHLACDALLLEPGRVVMSAEATRTIERVRAAGVEVLEVSASSLASAGTGVRGATMEIHREPGPRRLSG